PETRARRGRGPGALQGLGRKRAAPARRRPARRDGLRGRQNDRRVARQGAVLANFGRWAAREPRARRDDHPREPELSLPELILPVRGGWLLAIASNRVGLSYCIKTDPWPTRSPASCARLLRPRR